MAYYYVYFDPSGLAGPEPVSGTNVDILKQMQAVVRNFGGKIESFKVPGDFSDVRRLKVALQIQNRRVQQGGYSMSANPMMPQFRTKLAVLNYIYKVISPQMRGIFAGDDWRYIHQIFDALDAMGLKTIITSTAYSKNEDGEPAAKTWYIEVYYHLYDQDGNVVTPKVPLYGQIVAAGAGTVQRPLSRYDINMMLG